MSKQLTILLTLLLASVFVVCRPIGAKASTPTGKLVTGIVVDQDSAPIMGASVVVKQNNNGVVTGADGSFSIMVDEGNTLIVSYLGYSTEEIAIGTKNSYTITLTEGATSLDELVVVGYGVQKKATLTGSVAAIGNESIVKTKNENVQNMLTGKVAGLRVVQYSSEPGAFKTEFNIRGMGNPLIIIDGVPRDNMERLDSEDIENISILKDASAAIYGVKAANGVVLITTKSGSDTGGKVNLSYNGNFTWQYTAGLPKAVGAVDLMIMDNEKGMNSTTGGAWRYTQEEIDAYLNGTKTSTDWYNAVVKNGAPQYSHNLNINGGTNRTQYYASLGYKFQDSFFRSGDFNYDRYNIRANIHSNITDNLALNISMSGIMDTKNASSTSARTIIYNMWYQYPTDNIFENGQEPYYTFPDNKKNPVQAMQSDEVGYNKIDKKWFQSSASLTYKVPFISGLSAKAEVSYDYNLTDTKLYEKEYYYYVYDSLTDTYNGTALNSPSKLTRSFASGNSLLYQFSVNYDNTFGDAHHVVATLVSEGRSLYGDGFYASRELSIDVDELFAGNATNQVG